MTYHNSSPAELLLLLSGTDVLYLEFGTSQRGPDAKLMKLYIWATGRRKYVGLKVLSDRHVCRLTAEPMNTPQTIELIQSLNFDEVWDSQAVLTDNTHHDLEQLYQLHIDIAA